MTGRGTTFSFAAHAVVLAAVVCSLVLLPSLALAAPPSVVLLSGHSGALLRSSACRALCRPRCRCIRHAQRTRSTTPLAAGPYTRAHTRMGTGSSGGAQSAVTRADPLHTRAAAALASRPRCAEQHNHAQPAAATRTLSASSSTPRPQRLWSATDDHARAVAVAAAAGRAAAIVHAADAVGSSQLHRRSAGARSAQPRHDTHEQLERR